MRTLQEMSLVELAAAIGDAMHDESKLLIPFAAEMQRRQRQLDAAEGMYGALASEEAFFGFRTSTLADAFRDYREARNAYTAAKGDR